MPRALVTVAILALAAAGPTAAADVIKLKPTDVIYADGQNTALKEPAGVGCGSGSVVVADSGNGRLVVYTVTDRGVRAAATIVRPEIPFPLRVSLLASGEMLVLDGRSRRIARLDAAGELKGWIEPAGDAAGTAIRSFAVDGDGKVWVLDIGRGRVAVLGATGQIERTIAFAHDARSPSDVTVDERGSVYVVDSVLRRVDVARKGEAAFAPLTPALTEDMDFPTSIVASSDGRLLLVDENGGGIVILGRDGSFQGRQLTLGWKDGMLRYPSDACFVGETILVVADRENNRAQVFAVGR